VTANAGGYLTGIAPMPQRLKVPEIDKEIAEDIGRARLIDHCEATEAGLVDRAVASVEAASPLPLEESSHADRRLVADLERHDRRVDEAEKRAERGRTLRDELENALLRTPRSWPRGALAGCVAAFAVLALVLGAVVGLVLAGNLDSGFLGNYLGSKFDGDARLLSGAVSFLAAGGFVFLVATLQLAAVLGTVGRLGGLRTAQLLALDLVFAGAWGAQRLAEGGRAMAASITLLEFVAMAAYTIALGAFAAALRKNDERAERYRPALASARAAAASCVKAEAELSTAEAARRVLLEAVAARELSGRTSETRQKLVAEHARTAYRVSLGAAIESAIANPTHERLNSDLDRQLAERAALVAEPPTSKGRS
jgi:hypothetical protein